MLKALTICALLALVYSIAWGLGSYALAPGGKFVDWTMQGVSHDWHQYRWFFQEPGAWEGLAPLGTFAGLLVALLVVPITCGVAALLFWRMPMLQERLLKANGLYLCCTVIGPGLLTGVVLTIISGRNPGIP
ncbi:MAG: hypothetical protein WB810_06910 [Candidatus Cybelea sp.]